jgi:hypothetical protein
MTLRELETYLAVEITGSYHQRIHGGLHRAPIAVWREFSALTPLRMPKDRIAFWVSFLPDDKRVLRPDGLHLFGLKYWHGALARDVGRTDKKILVRYDPRDISRVFVARPSGRFIEARWQDLTLPPVSLHEWRNELKARNKTARDERDTRAMMKAIAQKRQIVDRASAATLLARETVVEKSRLDPLNTGFGTLRGAYQEFRVRAGRTSSQATIAFEKRSANMTAIWALAAAHSRGGIFHSFSERFKTRNSNFSAASSLGKWPLARTARRSLEFSASMAFVTGMREPAPKARLRATSLRRMVRPSGTEAPGARRCGQADLFDEP